MSKYEIRSTIKSIARQIKLIYFVFYTYLLIYGLPDDVL